ncbi:MAG: SGNH/GDSL hydrolase family protein [Pirellulales bacterium]
MDAEALMSPGLFRPMTLPTLVAILLRLQSWYVAAEARPERWENDIRAFEQQDRKAPPAAGQVLFVGSSSIRGWNLKQSFPKLDALNRGFGGSEIADSVRYADRIIVPYKPRIIVFYAGDNDLAAGKSPAAVLADFKALAKTVHAALPKTRILFLTIKPSQARWKLIDRIREANSLVREFIKTDERLIYVDVYQPLLGADGKPRDELFQSDGLHLNAKGYKLWASIVAPYLEPPKP